LAQLIASREFELQRSEQTAVISYPDPNTHNHHWKRAMDTELKSCHKKQVSLFLRLVTLNKTPIRSKCVYRKKFNTADAVTKPT
jgi:hypothetical protein